MVCQRCLLPFIKADALVSHCKTCKGSVAPITPPEKLPPVVPTAANSPLASSSLILPVVQPSAPEQTSTSSLFSQGVHAGDPQPPPFSFLQLLDDPNTTDHLWSTYESLPLDIRPPLPELETDATVPALDLGENLSAATSPPRPDLSSKIPLLSLAQAPADTAQTDLMKANGLLVNLTHALVICIACSSSINPDEIRQHIQSFHRHVHPQKDLNRLLRAQLERYPLSFAWPPEAPVTPVDPIYGLSPPETNYHLCTRCCRAFKGRDSNDPLQSASHVFNSHRCNKDERPNSNRPFTLASVQKFANGRQFTWFPVKDESIPITPDIESMWATYRAEMVSRDSPSQDLALPDNFRVLHQFIQKERWLDHVNDKDSVELMKLVHIDADDHLLPYLHRHVHAYLAYYQARLHDHYARRLIGTRPSAEHAVTYQLHHADTQFSTHNSYAHTLASCIAFVVRNHHRPCPSYHFSMSSAVSNACQALLDAFAGTGSTIAGTYDGTDHPTPSEGAVAEDDDEHADVLTEEDRPTVVPTPDPDACLTAYGGGEVRKIPPYCPAIQLALRELLVCLFTETPTAQGGDGKGFFHAVQRFLILASIRPDGMWLPSNSITQLISPLLFTGHLTMYSVMYAARLNDPGLSTHEAFKLVERHLEESTEGIMPKLYLLLRGLSHLESADDNIIKFNAPDCLGTSAIFGDRVLRLEELKVVHEELVQEATKIMDELLFNQPDFQLPQDLIIHEDPLDRTPGYGFVNDQRNVWAQGKTVLEHILTTPELFARFGYRDRHGKV
ncbi:hypothetical protein EW146_g2124, partial [Bondarzewia mesenterica]